MVWNSASAFVRRRHPLARLIVHLGVALSLGLLVPLAASGQISAGAPAASYEGQTVNAVSVVANPHWDIAPLMALVKQKAGQPYSERAVQETLAQLRASGKSNKIDVNTTPEADGLRVSFVLQPAYYIGVLSFSEASKHFSYTRLLQVVNLNDQDPYDASRIPVTETALKTFLRNNGYFQAQVQAQLQLDDDHRLVNIDYQIQLGRMARLGNIEITGASQPESTQLIHSVRSLRARLSGGLLKSGKTYSPGRISEAVKLMKRTLIKQHRLANRVSQDQPVYHPETNRVDLSFHVEVGPVVIVHITGARLSPIPFLSSIQAKKLIPIYSEGAIDRDLVQEGQQNLVDYFQKKGYFDVSVNTQYQKSPDQISLTYQIVKGRKHKVARITFRGNHAVSADDLESHLTLSKAHFFSRGKFSEKLLKSSARNIEALYKDIGYEDVKVSSQAVDHESTIDVGFSIEEGPQTIVDNLQISGNSRIPLSELVPKGLELKSGGPFSPRKLSDDRSRIAATYLDKGYLNADVKTRITRRPEDKNRVDVAIEISENQQVRIGDVVYLGQQHTRHALLQKATALAPEAEFSQGKLLESESNLYDLGILDWASVGPREPITDQTAEPALVKVHEAKRNEITYGFGFEVSHRGGNAPTGTVAVPGLPVVGIGNRQVAPSQAIYASPRGSIEFTRRNLRGMGETGSIALLVSRLDQRFLATYTDPHFRNTNWNALTSLSAERTTENPLYAASLEDGSFQIERPLGKTRFTRLQLRYDFNKTNLSQLLVPELVLPRDRSVHLSTFSGTLIRDTRDKPLDAHHGSLATVDLGITPTALGSSANFARLFSQYAFYKPVHSMVWANSIRLGLVKSFSGSFVPTSQLFFTGGGTSLRGFPIDEAGPQRIVPFCDVLTGGSGCVNITVPVGGRELFILNSELRFPLGIMKALGGVVFYDGGNVYTAINFNEFVNNYTNTVGLGLRYATPIGPIRIDIGRNLNPVPGINPTQYFITIGQAF